MTARRNAITKRRAEPGIDAPLSDDEFERGLGAMLARHARAATGLSQSVFSKRFGIPAATLRDWEQGRRAPDGATQSYLRVIAKMPDAVAKALKAA
ncbi:Transcriptional regulator, XRE family [Rhodospirillaceae bacterium LM-1]|nr:Transcriptional regulator, XRE family [Rhodospirillaceae bacterium LM-1]